jgi:hypothetical protein
MYYDALETFVENNESNLEAMRSQIISQRSSLVCKHFMGCRILVEPGARKQLPHLAPDLPPATWKIIKNFVGQDLTKVSMPVIINEPLSALQRNAEFLCCAEAKYREAAQCDDSLRRLILTWVASITGLNSIKKRKKKPFNPMLGETFEMVGEHYRFLAEKIQHTPIQISCSLLEGLGYKVWAYDKPNFKFGFGGGRGMIEIGPKGFFDIYYKKYDEHISIQKGPLYAKNIIFGGVYIDLGGQSVVYSAKTKEKVVIDWIEKVSDAENSRLKGTAFDAQGKARYEIYGSYLDEISMLNLATGEREVLWTEPPMMPNAHLQFFYNPFAVLLNHTTDEMAGVIAPTDSRFRMDNRLFEQGLHDEADAEKVEIEQQQRRQRKLMEAGQLPQFKGNFFREIPHPHITDELEHHEEKPIMYELIEDDDNNYWARRQRRDWAGMPNLWGPFD